MMAGKYEDAEQLLNEALGKNNNDAFFMHMLGRAEGSVLA